MQQSGSGTFEKVGQSDAEINTDTLDRIDNDNPAYGPGLCRWADKATQNGNKSNNHKIFHPTTGELFSPAQIAKMHGVQTKTVYKWIDAGYTLVELLAGKKSVHLAALQAGLNSLPTPKVPKGPAVRFRVPPPPVPPKEWNPTNEELDHYNCTGEMLDSRFEEKLVEHQEIVGWVIRHNAGIPQPTKRPKWKHWRVSALNADRLFGPSKPLVGTSPKPVAKVPGSSHPSQSEGVSNVSTVMLEEGADDCENEDEADESDPDDYDPPNC